MKMMKYGFVVVLILALALLFLNGSIPKKYLKAVDRTGNFAGPVTPEGQDTLGGWTSFVSGAEQAIAANEKRIAAFRETIEEAGPKAIQEFRPSVDALDRKNGELKSMLHFYTEQRRMEQDMFRRTFILALDSIGQRMHRVMKENG
jgi:hypothetical protein